MSTEKQAMVKELLESNRIFLMLKGTPNQPRCGFSARVVRVLEQYELTYHYFNIFDNPELMDLIKEYANWPTTPQLFVEGELIGGCDIVEQLHLEGQLKAMLERSADPVVN